MTPELLYKLSTTLYKIAAKKWWQQYQELYTGQWNITSDPDKKAKVLQFLADRNTLDDQYYRLVTWGL